MSRNPAPGNDHLDRAVATLSAGGLAVFPTETVYGLGAVVGQRRSLVRLREIKGLPPDRPLSVHCSTEEQLPGLVESVPAAARRLADALWPGPLTIILRPGPGLPAGVASTGGVGIRIVAHPLAVELIRRLGLPLAGTSANLHGAPPPVRLADVPAELLGRVDCALDGGPCPVGKPSTIVDVTGAPRLIREGAIDQRTVESVLGHSLA